MVCRALFTAWMFVLVGWCGPSHVRSEEPKTISPAESKELPADQAGKDSLGKKQQAEKDAEYYEMFKVLADTMDQVERNYVKDISRRELLEAAIRGVLEKLDPYSN